ncbi:type II toxin-antitoxin system Phd/YefM family antitoxin [Sphingomonas sp. RHCKR7]|uniref:type II toxin-antitoxin system Phd/YefM family antitoxin n=1 Tax=Sphingomonas folli TaxID=2862497 RepID=UPI001CA51BB4|nr:type II toxin-antitoxin system Phd/YefM family antitoxin [Sphingomonas folli]MBW6528371.1 type II toxin-antitoxin system Phd/YefM family antitoxin [Sphingomonas folli]
MGKVVGITEFKARCLALLGEMERSGEPLTITRRGRPALTLTARELRAEDAGPFGGMRGTVAVHGDIVAPLEPDDTARDAAWDTLGFPVSDAPAR